MHVYLDVCIPLDAFVHMYIHVHVYIYTCRYTCTHVYILACALLMVRGYAYMWDMNHYTSFLPVRHESCPTYE